VTLPPLPAPPRSLIIEKFPNQPDRPRDIILERWLPYEHRYPSRTVRVAAETSVLPEPPHNRIIQYQTLAPSIVRQFERLGVVRADPHTYIQQYGSTLLDSGTFVRKARDVGVVEDITTPASGVVGFAASTYDLGGSTENIITGTTEYTRAGRIRSPYGGYTTTEHISRGGRYPGDYESGTHIHTTEITSDDTLSSGETGGFIHRI